MLTFITLGVFFFFRLNCKLLALDSIDKAAILNVELFVFVLREMLFKVIYVLFVFFRLQFLVVAGLGV